MSDNDYSPSTSNDALHHFQDSSITKNNHESLVKSSDDSSNPVFSSKDNRQKSSISLSNNQGAMVQSTRETCQQIMDNIIKPSISRNQHDTTEILTFSGKKNEDAGKWLDNICEVIEQQELTSSEQRDVAVRRLTGDALLWYRLNRLKMPDMQSFIHQFLLMYHESHTKTATTKDIHYTYTLSEETIVEKELEHMDSNTSKLSSEENHGTESSSRYTSPLQVLQSARNEKVKLFPNFSGSENSLNWLKSLQQVGKALKLNDQQIYELATIKLSGPAQEWFYHQDEEVDNWLSFKQVFLHAFPPPIQPTNIDYLAQLLARKQGETEPVGKFVQDINRLCLKLENKISEQDKLQYLRRGLRPELQHYALSITSLQDFLTIMQRHEQIEKEKISNQQALSSFRSMTKPDKQQQTSYNQNYDYQQNYFSTQYESSGYHPHQNINSEKITRSSDKEWRICYQCNKPGHLQRDCPDNNSTQQYQQHFQQRSH